MRRHPVAVYRVIDEEELLGGEDFELASRQLVGAHAPDRKLRRQRRRWSGWRSTALGVVALACIAGLLLDVSPRAQAPVPSRRSGAATSAGRVLRVVEPAGLPTPSGGGRTGAPRRHRRLRAR